MGRDEKRCQEPFLYSRKVPDTFFRGNPLRAGLTARAEEWLWSSLGRRQRGEARGEVRLESWPLPRPRDWAARVNRAETEAQVEAIRRSIARGCPFGEENWQQETAANLGLE
jgi:putative transposase